MNFVGQVNNIHVAWQKEKKLINQRGKQGKRDKSEIWRITLFKRKEKEAGEKEKIDEREKLKGNVKTEATEENNKRKILIVKLNNIGLQMTS